MKVSRPRIRGPARSPRTDTSWVFICPALVQVTHNALHPMITDNCYYYIIFYTRRLLLCLNMDTSTLVQVINEAAGSQRSANEADKARILEACTGLVSSLQSPMQNLIELLFGVCKQLAVLYCPKFLPARQSSSSSSWY
jgi:hypothetical protein